MVRGAVVKHMEEELVSDFKKLADFQQHGIMELIRVKNGWRKSAMERKGAYHYTTILCNGIVTSTHACWDTVADFLDNRAEHGVFEGEPGIVFRRRQHMFAAASYLRDHYATTPIQIVCEVQLILKSELERWL